MRRSDPPAAPAGGRLARIALVGSFLIVFSLGRLPMTATVSSESAPAGASQGFTGRIAELQALEADKLHLPEAETFGKRLLAQAVDQMGADSPEAIEIRGVLVRILMQIGKKRLPEAVGIAEAAVASADRLYGPADPHLRQPLKDLGDALDYIGSFVEAKTVYLRRLKICEMHASPADDCAADALTALGNTSRRIGDYAGARLFYGQALEKLDTATPGQIAGTLYALSVVDADEGDMDHSVESAERAVRIMESDTTSERFFLYFVLNHLAGLYRDVGRCAEARDLLERCLRHWRETRGEEDGSVTMALSNQARVISRLGEHQAAIDQAKRALDIVSRHVPAEDRTLVFYLRNLAIVHVDAGQDALAEPLLQKAIRLNALALGQDHPALAPLLDTLAGVEYRLGRHTEATQHALRAESIARAEFQSRSSVLSERQAYQYESSRASSLRFVLSALSRRGASRETGLVESAWDGVVRSRALVLDEIASRSRAAMEMKDPAISALVADLQTAKSRLAALALQQPGAGPDSRGGAFKDAVARKERLERDLAALSVGFRREMARHDMGMADVRTALPADASLLAYVAFDRLTDASGANASSRNYAAFVLSGDSPTPQFFLLGPASEIDELVQSWRRAAATNLSGHEPLLGTSERAYRDAGRLLGKRIWDPVSRALGRARMVFVVPDGALNFVNLAALPAGEDRYLLETGPLIHHLSTERDLIRKAPMHETSEEALLLGAPDLDAPIAPAAAGVPLSGALADLAPQPGFSTRRSGVAASPACEDLRSLRFGSLPAARSEIEDIAAVVNPKFHVVELSGAAATESAFKTLAPGRRILHLAAHGFYFQGRCVSALETAETRGIASAGPGGQPIPLAGDNPLLLSGIALAGANRRAERSPGDTITEDGMLTAEEVGALDLSATEWVVLSACETGVGKVLPGEGVLGLRRAFAVAGAGSLIMSLWQVDDAATRQWMKRLYEGRLHGLSTADAVREAGLWLIREQRTRGRTTHPFFWGGFVAEGDWR